MKPVLRSAILLALVLAHPVEATAAPARPAKARKCATSADCTAPAVCFRKECILPDDAQPDSTIKPPPAPPAPRKCATSADCTAPAVCFRKECVVPDSADQDATVKPDPGPSAAPRASVTATSKPPPAAAPTSPKRQVVGTRRTGLVYAGFGLGLGSGYMKWAGGRVGYADVQGSFPLSMHGDLGLSLGQHVLLGLEMSAVTESETVQGEYGTATGSLMMGEFLLAGTYFPLKGGSGLFLKAGAGGGTTVVSLVVQADGATASAADGAVGGCLMGGVGWAFRAGRSLHIVPSIQFSQMLLDDAYTTYLARWYDLRVALEWY